MEAIASYDYPLISLILTNETLRERDVYAAMLSACAKGSAQLVSCLLPKASQECISHGLLVASKLAHLDLSSVEAFSYFIKD